MKKKWSSHKVKDLQRWLALRWPDLFTPGPDLRPLSLTIYKEILGYRKENPSLSGRVLREALKRHTSSYGYLYGTLKNRHRYDLTGTAVAELTDTHKMFARKRLRAMQKVAQKERKIKRAAQFKTDRKRNVTQAVQKTLKRPAGSEPVTTRTPVIRYKQAKRKVVLPQEPRVELAS